MAKVILSIKDGKATIVEGKDTLIGKLLALKGKLKIKSPLIKEQEVEIA